MYPLCIIINNYISCFIIFLFISFTLGFNEINIVITQVGIRKMRIA